MDYNKNMSIWLLIFLSLYFISPSEAQEIWTNYTNGNMINSIVAQNDYVWCATSGGVVRWDKSDSIYTKYTTVQGLCHNVVNSIAIGPDGILWFGTEGGGVSIFDDKTWKTYTTEDGLIDNSVVSIETEPNGNVWFGTNCGVSRFDGKEWTSFTTDDGLAYDSILSIERTPDGKIWFGTRAGIFCFDGEKITGRYISLLKVHSLQVGPDGTLWRGTSKDVSCFDGEKWNSIGEFESFLMAIGPDGIIWCSTRSGTKKFDGESWSLIPDLKMFSIAYEQNGIMWYTTEKELNCYNGIYVTQFRTEDGLAGNYVNSIAISPNGGVWSGTRSGASYFDGKTWITFTDRRILSIAIGYYDVLWIGEMGSGVSQFDGETWTKYTESQGLGYYEVQSIVIAPDSTVWCATGECLSRFDGETWKVFTPEINKKIKVVNKLTIAPDGSVWCLTPYKLLRFDGMTWTMLISGDDYPDTILLSLAVDQDGDVLVGTYTEGVFCYDGEKWVTYTTDDGLVNNNVRSIYEMPDGTLWFGTDGGVSRYDGETWTSYTSDDGLGGNMVMAINSDSQNRLWFGTNGGVSVLELLETNVETIVSHSEFIIIGIYPNPFNPSTTIEFNIPSFGFTTLTIYNIMGQKIRELVADNFQAGTHSILWDGRDDNGNTVSSGIYISRLKNGEHVAVKQMTMIK